MYSVYCMIIFHSNGKMYSNSNQLCNLCITNMYYKYVLQLCITNISLQFSINLLFYLYKFTISVMQKFFLKMSRWLYPLRRLSPCFRGSPQHYLVVQLGTPRCSVLRYQWALPRTLHPNTSIAFWCDTLNLKKFVPV